MPLCPKCSGKSFPLGQVKTGSIIYTCISCGWSVNEAPNGDVGHERDVHGMDHLWRNFKPSRENYWGSH